MFPWSNHSTLPEFGCFIFVQLDKVSKLLNLLIIFSCAGPNILHHWLLLMSITVKINTILVVVRLLNYPAMVNPANINILLIMINIFQPKIILTFNTVCKALKSLVIPNLRKWRDLFISVEVWIIFVVKIFINLKMNVTKISQMFIWRQNVLALNI